MGVRSACPAGRAPCVGARAPRILIVDDDEASSFGLDALLEELGYCVRLARSGASALELIPAYVPDVVVTDLRMPGIDGIELARRLAVISPATAVLVITAYADVPTAIEAIRSGAADYLVRPLEFAVLAGAIERALAASARRKRSDPPASGRRSPRSLSSPPIVGASAPMRRLEEMIQRLAPSNATVLLLGETGTGKGLVARRIHDVSPRAAAPFVALHCASLPHTLLETELFGHEKGAFTGAIRRHIGRFEQAHRGTLFLDEVGEISLATQVKLLRVVEERAIERVGGARPIDIDVRIIAATHRDLAAEARDGRFRADLYYRLGGFPIEVPPLRDRGFDVHLLADHFLERVSLENGRPICGFSSAARKKLLHHRWSGNVRQLEHAIERAALLCGGDIIDACDLELD